MACKKEPFSTTIPDTAAANENGIPIRLGKKLNNPYSVAIMRQAYKNLVNKHGYRINSDDIPNPTSMDSIIVSTNTYIRVLPASDEEQELLQNDSTTEYVHFPLDYELSEGTYYQDPELPDSSYQWLYAVVDNDELPKQQRRASTLNTEVLNSDIFLPENSEYYYYFDSTFWEMLENEALNLAGYPEETGNKSVRTGNIEIFEEVYGNGVSPIERNIPLQDAKVLGRNFWRIGKGYTNAFGYFQLNKQLNGNVNFFIKWEDDRVPHKFDIRAGFYGQAYSMIGKKPSGQTWKHIISKDIHGGMDIFYGSIFRGAYDFFHHDPFGIAKPTTRIKIGTKNTDGTGVNHHFYSIVGGPDITIYRYENTNVKTSYRLYSTTTHEMGHSSHRSMGVVKYNFCPKLISESYADFIEWAFCETKYWGDIRLYNNEFRHPDVKITVDGSSPYTPLFIDLADIGSGNSFFNKPPDDIPINENLQFSVLQIQEAVRKKGWAVQTDNVLDDLSAELKTLNIANTEELDAYFNLYKNLY